LIFMGFAAGLVLGLILMTNMGGVKPRIWPVAAGNYLGLPGNLETSFGAVALTWRLSAVFSCLI
jgi:hypothetical protein